MRSIGMAAVLGFVLMQGCASQQVRKADADSGTTTAQILSAKIKADKKLLVANNMDLTEPEAAKFWPFYDEYQQDLELINRRLGRTILHYTEAFRKGPLPDSTAEQLLEESLAVEEEEVALKQSYAERMGQVLPEAKVARYLQIETKMRSAVKLELASQIPLVY